MTYSEKAQNYFSNGHNCAQSVLLAFSDLTGLDETTAMKLSSSFGGGMGKLREVCGAVSAMFMVAGLLYDKGVVPTLEEKSAHYAKIQDLAAKFRAQNGSILCRDLLANVETSPDQAPEARTDEYYKKRPCGELCAFAADILSQYIKDHPLDQI